jgi:hypothetical protein
VQYLVLIYETPFEFESRTHPERAAGLWGSYAAYTKALTEAGVMVGGNALKLPDTATTVRLRKGERLVQDGPYADTKEQLGGYYVIDVPDLDAALSWAARCPAASMGAVEVRPVWPMSPK